jgi:formylglycine-generating enzyme required for sulfatase activity
MGKEIPDSLFDRLAEVLSVDEADRDELIDSFDLTVNDETTLRGLLVDASSTSDFDLGIGAMFPSLLGKGIPEVDGFEVIRELGRGGMGIVYLARDTDLKRYVALKFIRGGSGEREQQRLLDEARTVAGLDHHGIVHIHQLGRYADGVFTASAYIEGETLRDRLDRERTTCEISLDDDTRLDRKSRASSQFRIQECLKIVREITAAVGYAHRQGIVHRDLKPSNILIDEHGTPFVTDFGIAVTAGATGLSEAPAGTIGYMSPEQAGATREPVSAATDVYALGVLLFELLTLRRPTRARTLDALQEEFCGTYRSDPRGLNPALPAELSVLCKKALAQIPADRYQDANELLVDLDRALAGTLPPPGLSVARAIHFVRTRRLLAAIAGSMALTTTGAAIAFNLMGSEAPAVGTVRFQGAGTDAVEVRVFDPETRMPREPTMHKIRGNEIDLAPGLYRITTTVNGSIHEYTRMVSAEETVSINPPRASPAIDLESMVLVRGGEYVVGYDEGPLQAIRTAIVTIEPFLIEKHEVSNADYRDFVLETGHASPLHWPEPYDPALDPLPIVGVRQSDARAYAEWTGKRLPTHIEWEIAAAGQDRFRHPWGNDPRDLATVETGTGYFAAGMTDFDDPMYMDLYLGRVEPCGSSSVDLTPAGLVHMAGNVAEWTDSYITPFGIESDEAVAIVKGNAFSTPETRLLRNQEAIFATAETPVIGIGFRCAVSILREN